MEIVVTARRNSRAVITFCSCVDNGQDAGAPLPGNGTVANPKQVGMVGGWKVLGQTFGWIGRNGLGKRREGDGKTPVGEFGFLYAFGTLPNPGSRLPYLRIDDSYYLVDDVKSRYYNQIVSLRDVDRDWESAEHMAGMGRAYAYGLMTDYNFLAVPGVGSGIFLHCGDRHPTAGCVAIPQGAMYFLLRNMASDCRLLIRGSNGNRQGAVWGLGRELDGLKENGMKMTG